MIILSHFEKAKQLRGFKVYCGRGGNGRLPSYLKNPIKLLPGEQRGATLGAFKTHLYREINKLERVHKLLQGLALKSKRGHQIVLMCHCEDVTTCHCNVIRDALNWYIVTGGPVGPTQI